MSLAAHGTRTTPGSPSGASGSTRARGRVRDRVRDADGMAVAAFVLGLVGLLVMNILLGPVAIGLAVLALRRGTARRGRALLGLGLGVADLVVLATLVTLDGTVSWSIA
ncbi:DUF4190 domain-containing protein [Streptomyces lavendofoliae]|uniref:DUF4190 domain-containing protein n=1 Tax=Streptomyces lavendofoliae TaxID=67314 RepID=A0A918I0L4_9ACTN|nr:DUF4190 domain-containing protein [Streptomyces lavendofoliae]GGU44099.1 hypothetical protein GCM10010274_35090 [Streptomyces lavendofoliae]